MGLLTKLNLLTIGLIFLTAIATTGYYVWQQWRDETSDLRQRGATALAMLAELSEFGALHQQPRVPRGDPREPVRRRRHRLRGHRRSQGRGRRRAPHLRHARARRAAGARRPTRCCRRPAPRSTAEVTIRGRRYVELDRAGERHEDRDRDGLDQGPPEPAADNAAAPLRRDRDADGLRPARDDVRAAAAAVQKASRRRAFRHRAADRPHDRRDLPAHARPRRADASADARGARGRRRQARRVRPRALVGRARARSRTRSTT